MGLCRLELENNLLGNKAATSIGLALGKHPALTKLFLNNDRVGDAGIAAIADGLKVCV